MEELQLKIKLLAKPIWAERDIVEFFEVSRPVAKRMLDQSITKGNGKIYGFPNKVKSESVIALYCGHSKKEELEILCAGVNKLCEN